MDGVMRRDFLVDFLALCLHEQGVPNARQAAERVAADLYRVHLVEPTRVFIVHRRVRMYELRKHMTIQELSQRFGVCEAMVKRDIKTARRTLKAS